MLNQNLKAACKRTMWLPRLFNNKHDAGLGLSLKIDLLLEAHILCI